MLITTKPWWFRNACMCRYALMHFKIFAIAWPSFANNINLIVIKLWLIFCQSIDRDLEAKIAEYDRRFVPSKTSLRTINLPRYCRLFSSHIKVLIATAIMVVASLVLIVVAARVVTTRAHSIMYSRIRLSSAYIFTACIAAAHQACSHHCPSNGVMIYRCVELLVVLVSIWYDASNGRVYLLGADAKNGVCAHFLELLGLSSLPFGRQRLGSGICCTEIRLNKHWKSSLMVLLLLA